MALPLTYIRIPSTTPFALTYLTFLIRLSLAYSEELKKEIADEFQQSRLFQLKFQQACDSAAQQGRGHPLYPPPSHRTQWQALFGESIALPAQFTNPEIYEWKRGPHGDMKLPWFMGYLLTVSDARDRVNALEHLRGLLYAQCQRHGIKGDFDAPLLWMVFTKQADPYFLQYGTGDDARRVVSSIGDALLTQHLLNEGPEGLALACATIIHGMKTLKQREGHQNATIDS